MRDNAPIMRPIPVRIPRPTWFFVALVAAMWILPTAAQYGERALVAPGDPLPPGLIATQGGPAGRDLAPLVGKRPVLVAYWRPGDGLSEAALTGAVDLQKTRAQGAVVFPVAVLAASQAPESIRTRLDALGLADLPARQDGGQLARIVGIRKTPSFVLIDAGGVLRLVGGGDVQQNSPAGMTIAQALELAAVGKPVPNLGTLPSRPVYRLLGRKLPDLAGTDLDGTTWRKISDLRQPGKKTLLFYWSPTCPHCKRALPKLGDWYNKARPDDLLIIDIARADSPYLAREVPGLIGQYPWPHLLDKDRSISRALMARETPSSYLLSADGEVLGIKIGERVNWGRWLGSD